MPRGVPGSRLQTQRDALQMSADGWTRAAIASKMGLTSKYLSDLGVPEYPSSQGVVDLTELPDDALIDMQGDDLPAPIVDPSSSVPAQVGGDASRNLALSLASRVPFAGSDIGADELIHDAAMCTLLHQFLLEYPDGVVRQGTQNTWDPPGPVIGQVLFTGGTALSMCHGVTERYSEDLDFSCLPDPGFTLTTGSKRRVQDQLLNAAREGLGAEVTEHGIVKLKQRISLNQVEYAPGATLAIDLAWRDDFTAHPHLLSVTFLPATSLLERFVDADHLPVAARGPHMVPCVGVPYIAATKLDAQHLRAEQKDYKGMADRARDLYDLAMIARSEHADEVRAMLPDLAEIIKHDVRNKNKHPRPDGGYANSPAFQHDFEGLPVMRAGYQRLVEPIVYGVPVSFDEALDLIRSLDST